jgi:chemotaxis protein histidine kinase CheA
MPLSQDDQAKYKGLYLQTARDYIKELQENTGVLIVTPHKVEALESVHRAAHSLTSQSVMMEYHEIGSVASVMEKLFQQTVESKTFLTKEVLQSLLDTLEHMAHDLDALDKNNEENDLSQDAAKLQTLLSK